MQLAVNLVPWEAGQLARAAEQAGYAAVLAPEGLRSEAAAVLGLVAGMTERVELISGVMQIPGRPPGMAALTAATLNAVSGGRFRLGLGVSNPDVSLGWYGVPFDRPLGRIREYVDIVRQALSGAPVMYQGEHFEVGTSGPLRLLTEPSGGRVPVLLAAVGPRSLRLAGEIADGWLGVFTSPEAVTEAVGHIRKGRGSRGLDGFEVLPSLPTAVADTVQEAADLVRGHYVHLMGIGDPARNVYCALARSMGYEAEVDRFAERIEAGDRRGAGAVLPLGLLDRTALLGPVGRIADRMRAYAEAGVTRLGIMVSAAATGPEGRLAIVRAAAHALESSGAAD
ncbi:LLM class flavin-dependent oxidoreductase [Streptomyces thermoviolaceus]|jgi:F420-dependent oxidoreductase-like protein|uniref:LLM class flavin-dependent oxidoreductase n=1 Tax=Streptomyces thermoviolaceus subsp. thermoviolaceus TaxID=66860 RepID=A0ABX0YWG0_STRTL|nr:LLM class flavin-dependent oxidoreductase [Streptomyces thermoviolaceus]MCM3264792.1 LLM class flavin-dependent oxidoreductase [Streptomyces thermoviolaceus]NJP16372.1 LLM class flavin-dependent oxidoreductase [Streptomyces thermoviolaceus subsp. thermoviolaceus]WTD48904.1 LLM class flavin-dependent oxidoreductase [Streptomyces thermoviolaceus]GHB08687.1 LLM class F420-dependent oxidoreductase [Streptomyces thermoviolaceus subsp. thermoviolaceus]